MSVRVRPAALELTTPSSSWPKVKKIHLKTGKPSSSSSSRHRPDTATLEKPLILDPGLIRKLDMTRTTREKLMTIENLIATPKKVKGQTRTKEKTTILSPRSKRKDLKVTDDSWEDDSSVSEEPKLRKLSRTLNRTFRIKSHVRKSLKEVLTPSPSLLQVPNGHDVENVRRSKSRSPVPRNKKTDDEFGEVIETVPSPCCTCGRKEQPERLHAHPKRTVNKKNKLKDDQENKEIKQKSSVTKPVAMKFRSGKSRGKVSDPPSTSPEVETKNEVSLIRRETFKVERGNGKHLPIVGKKQAPSSPLRVAPIKVRRSPVRNNSNEKKKSEEVSSSKELEVPIPKNPVVHSASSKRPRTIVCYLCSKQFFTTSFPMHEPHCLQKWQRENEELPAHLQMPLPQKPDVPLTSDEWNQFAWETAQAVLVPCEHCNRTFLPARLEAHLRACTQAHPVKKSCIKRQVQDWDSDKEDRSDRSEHIAGPPTVHCYICGRMFTKESVGIHEEHCLKRWQQENRANEESTKKSPSSASSPMSSPAHSSTQSSTQSTPRRRFVICYICGRQFGSKSIDIHEPQCLKKWHLENDKLPTTQRRQEPQKPDIVYDIETGRIDIEASAEAQWQSHLVQLIPCGKCGRTFNPDRVIIHERCCKGPQNKH